MTTWNNGLFDGHAALVVLQDLPTLLWRVGLDRVPLPPSPGNEDLIPQDLWRRRWLRQRMYAVVALVKLLQTLTGEGQVLRSVSRQDDLEILPYLLTPEQTTLLVERYRSEETTLLGALCAAFLQSLRRSCPPPRVGSMALRHPWLGLTENSLAASGLMSGRPASIPRTLVDQDPGSISGLLASGGRLFSSNMDSGI